MTTMPQDEIRAGYAAVDITPDPGLTLCGFAARCNRPSEGVDDPLTLHALALSLSDGPALLLIYDLLGLGPKALADIHAALDKGCPEDLAHNRRILICTHTHSAPAAIQLIGCGLEEPTYRTLLAEHSAAAAQAALGSQSSVQIREWRVSLPGHNYNRRTILEDGRVSMARIIDSNIRKRGGTIDTFSFLRIETMAGEPIVGLAHWAAHPITSAGMNVSGDFPAEFCRQLARREGYPFAYLQGACADLNPPFRKMNREEMLANVTSVMDELPTPSWSDPLATEPSGLIAWREPLAYQATMDREERNTLRQNMLTLSTTGTGSDSAKKMLADILNIEPGVEPDPVMLRYIADIMQRWCEQSEQVPEASPSFELNLHLIRLGSLILCFIAAEIYTETEIELKKIAGDLRILTVGYASPLAGYLSPDTALDEGGYEAAHAFKFYGHHAPFERGSVQRMLESIKQVLHAWRKAENRPELGMGKAHA